MFVSRIAKSRVVQRHRGGEDESVAIAVEWFDHRQICDPQVVAGPAELYQQGTRRGCVDGIRPFDDQLLSISLDRDRSPFDADRRIGGTKVDNIPSRGQQGPGGERTAGCGRPGDFG